MTLNFLIVLILIGGWLTGKLFTRMGLPSVLGMTLLGIALSYFYRSVFPEVIWEISPFFKSLALIVILLRAGLGISRATLKKVGLPAVLLSFIPCLSEGFFLMFLFHKIAGFELAVAGVAAFLLAAVSPAVVVPSMLDLKERGFGKKNDIPTMILAGASMDDVFAITIFTIFLGVAGGNDVSLLKSVAQIPLSIGGGVAVGLIVGFFLVWYFNRNHERIRATEKTLLLLGTAILLVQVGDWLHLAALLGVMTTGFILLEKSERAAHELAYNLNKAWVFAEILLFVLIGMSVDISVALDAGLKGLLIIFLGLIARSAGVLFSVLFAPVSWKERWFCVFSYLPKATVQAAMGSVPLAAGIAHGEEILAYAVMAIVFTAPLGLILIRQFGPQLLEVELPAEDSPEEGHDRREEDGTRR
ncbi:cation:proton antiporter [Spirochaeta isovalerica]|uniref:NhaP-type Na+/H+ or K+/H+ antiporter n=1 Tax=Spirochaeta isovalerica TaxID=150 RepID=A0A841R9H8_9SPIO|nr:cation:proton antiporter [Spirochaeta isovalerica]MBB6481994.1 NhaP-type Na+/H+ or K+/H+ antiporter [Spirochaeta isovalerica]